MTLRPVLALTPLLALLFVPCQCSNVGSIVRNVTANIKEDCNVTCRSGPECQRFVFWKEKSTCFLLNCSNGSSCLEIPEEELLAELVGDLSVQDKKRGAAAPDFNPQTESYHAASYHSSSSSSPSSARPTKNLEVLSGTKASLTSNSTKEAHYPTPPGRSSPAGQTSDAAEPSTLNNSLSASLQPTQPATSLPPDQDGAILPLVPKAGLKGPDTFDQPSTHTKRTPTPVTASTTAQIAIKTSPDTATVKLEPSLTTMTTATTTATTNVESATRTTPSTTVPPSTTTSASTTKPIFTSPSATTTPASSKEGITPPSSKKTTATTSTLASTTAAPVTFISITTLAAENKPSMMPTTPELSRSSPAPPIPKTLAPSPIATPGPVPVSTNKPGNTNVATVTRVAIVDVAGEALTLQLVDTSSLLAVLLFGLLFFVVAVGMFVKQAYESYQRKDYTQVDYLINGMYSDSGV